MEKDYLKSDEHLNRLIFQWFDYESYFNDKPTPNFCGDISEAWIVIEKLRQKGWLAVVKDMPDGFPYLAGDEPNAPKIFRRSTAEFQWMPRNTAEDSRKYIHSHTFSVADSPAKAICEAALKVIEIESQAARG